jgi:hypothetical protein
MTKNRVEAFSDGVLAIVITIMILELKVPHGSNLAALRPLRPRFLTYVLSFVFLVRGGDSAGLRRPAHLGCHLHHGRVDVDRAGPADRVEDESFMSMVGNS